MKDFIPQAIRTESDRQPLESQALSRLLHASIGMNTEQAEFADMLKKHIFYGKPLDEVNLKEELGDLLWYVAIAMHTLGTDFETEMERVIAKLRHRFPEKFTDFHAENRDLDGERAILESR